jgi:hypothetical protein
MLAAKAKQHDRQIELVAQGAVTLSTVKALKRIVLCCSPAQTPGKSELRELADGALSSKQRTSDAPANHPATAQAHKSGWRPKKGQSHTRIAGQSSSARSHNKRPVPEEDQKFALDGNVHTSKCLTCG